MNSIRELKQVLIWKFYYRYKIITERDSEGGYSLFQKILMILYISKVNLFGEYWSDRRFRNKMKLDPDVISSLIYNKLGASSSCMIARYGANEQRIVANYLSINNKKRSLFDLICGKTPYWWWNKKLRKEFYTNAGFFPNETAYIKKYSELMIEDTKQLDVLLIWYGWEPLIIGDNKSINLVGLYEAEPWWQEKPWTRVLRGKKVLVIHPFAELIESQYKKREYLFKNQDVLPEFDLVTIKAVQSISGGCTNFNNWFEALDWMKGEMDRINYDIALIGCGAYGFCLAAHAKRHGRKAFHMGGVLQLLFGIKGNRWEDRNYHPKFDYTSLFNEYWVKPGKEYKPEGAINVENECYW